MVRLATDGFIDGGAIVWWQMPADWQRYRAGYDFLFWVIAGLILAKFIDEPVKFIDKPVTG